MSDTSETMIVMPIYDAVEIAKYNDFLQKEIIQVKLAGKWGLIDNDGKVIIKPEHDQIITFKDYYPSYKINGVIIKSKGKYGISDFNNTIKIPCIYDTIYLIDVLIKNEYQYLLIASKANTFFTFSRDYTKTTCSQEDIRKKTADIQFETVAGMRISYPLHKPEMEEILNMQKNTYEGKFDSITILKVEGSSMLQFYRQSKFALIDINSIDNSHFLNADTSNSYFIDEVLDVKQGSYLVKRNGLISVVDESGELKIPFQYKTYKDWDYRVLYFTKNGKVGMQHLYLPLVFDAEYDDIVEVGFQDYTLWRVKVNNKVGYINDFQKKFYKD